MVAVYDQAECLQSEFLSLTPRLWKSSGSLFPLTSARDCFEKKAAVLLQGDIFQKKVLNSRFQEISPLPKKFQEMFTEGTAWPGSAPRFTSKRGLRNFDIVGTSFLRSSGHVWLPQGTTVYLPSHKSHSLTPPEGVYRAH